MAFFGVIIVAALPREDEEDVRREEKTLEDVVVGAIVVAKERAANMERGGALKKMKRHTKIKNVLSDVRRVYISFCISVFLHFKTDAVRVSPFLCREKTVFLTSRHDVLREERYGEFRLFRSRSVSIARALRDSSPLVSFFSLRLSVPLSAIDSNIFKSPW
jgi:hypothetical protein